MKLSVISEKHWLLLTILPLASGGALTVHILTHISLGLALLVAFVVVAVIGIMIWRFLTPFIRQEVTQRAKAGLLAGLLATVVYDLFRWLIEVVVSLNSCRSLSTNASSKTTIGGDKMP